jgi:hypothetical protein
MLLSACEGATQAPGGDPLPVPPASAGHSMAYHAGLGAVVLVNAGLGGMAPPPLTATTVLWKWTGTDWVVVDSNGPPVRNLAGFAYDEKRNVLVMHGGSYDLDHVYGETWEWIAETGWVRRGESGPGPRDHTVMAYDGARERVVLFGGQIGVSTFPADTWTWDGTTWRQAATTGPSARVHHSMVYDAAAQRVLLFGGSNSSGGLGDTWAWSGSAWTSAAPAIAARTHAVIGRSPRGVVLVGGFPQPAPAMLLYNAAWRVDQQPGAPTNRYLAAMAYDPVRNVTVLFGGGNAADDQLFGDTWEFSEGLGWRLVK